jgi:hypothetical protein
METCLEVPHKVLPRVGITPGVIAAHAGWERNGYHKHLNFFCINWKRRMLKKVQALAA